MNPTDRQPSTYGALMGKMQRPRLEPILKSRGLMMMVFETCPHVAHVEVDARPGVVRASLVLRWYVALGLGLWSRSIQRRAARVLNENLLPGWRGEVRVVSHAGAR